MKNDGGQAFPQIETDPESTADGGDTYGHVYSYGGMSLRDYFAAKAMEAEIITSCSDATPNAANDLVNAAMLSGQTVIESIAYNAYRMADAMLKAREQS